MSATRYVASLDIGGTSVKSAIVDDSGKIVESTMESRPVDSRGSRETILSTFAEALKTLMSAASDRTIPISGVGVSICGPFDYENGICKISGLDKYDSIYDVNVKRELIDRTRLEPDLPVYFDVDSWSFARGEVWAGAARVYRRVMVFTLGTGVGSAFVIDGSVVADGPGVPWYGWVSGQKFRDGILNDYISRTWMIERFRQLRGRLVDVKEIAEEAASGDASAAQVFVEFGETLGEFLQEYNLQEFQGECMVFGGRIANAFHLFEPTLRHALSDVSCLKAIVQAADIERSALRGAAHYVLDRIGPVSLSSR